MCKSFNLKKTLYDSSTVAQIAERFERNTVLRAFHTVQPGSHLVENVSDWNRHEYDWRQQFSCIKTTDFDSSSKYDWRRLDDGDSGINTVHLCGLYITSVYVDGLTFSFSCHPPSFSPISSLLYPPRLSIHCCRLASFKLPVCRPHSHPLVL